MKSTSEKNQKNSNSKTNTSNPKSESFLSYLDSNKNLQNLLILKNDLRDNNLQLSKFESSFKKFNDENIQISEIFKGEENILNKLYEEKNNIKLNDEIFENKTIEILAKTFHLKEYNLVPFFDISLSNLKKKNMIKIYYYKLECYIDDKKLSLLFLNNRTIFMFTFENLTFIFEKYKELFNTVTVITKDCNYFTNFDFQKDGQGWKVDILFADIEQELLKIQNQIKETENKIDSLNTPKEKEILKEKLKSYNNIYDKLKYKYSKNQISYEIEKNSNKITILEEKIKLNEEKNDKIKEFSSKIKKYKEKIENYKNLLKSISIRLTKKDYEFDGLFVTTKEITLKNKLNDSLTIPPKKIIIVEVKNNSNYFSLIQNIKKKKVFLQDIGFEIDSIYFIGILNNLNINKQEKQRINKKLNNFNFNNVIVVYPENLNFLDTQIYLPKKEEENEKNNTNQYIIQMIKDLNEKVSKLTNEVSKLNEKNK